MRPSWKLALVGGEVTLLAAFTGIGIHLAMQPHRVSFRPPALVLPSLRPPALPALAPPLAPPASPAPAAATPSPFVPALFAKFGQQDRNLLLQQWDILQHLTSAIARYVEARVVEQVEKKP
jgi:hypothetical protein